MARSIVEHTEGGLDFSSCTLEGESATWLQELSQGLVHPDPKLRLGGGPAGVKELYAQNALLDIDWGRLRDGSLESPLAKRVGPLLQASLPNTENGEVAEPRFGPVAGDTSWCAKFATI